MWHDSPEWLQQYLDQQDSLPTTNLPSYLNGGFSDRAIEASGAACGFYPLDHYREQAVGDLHEDGPTECGLVAPSLSILSSSGFPSSEVLGSTTHAESGAPSKVIHDLRCTCISCFQIGWFHHPMGVDYHQHMTRDELQYYCRYPGCQERIYYCLITNHERSHFLKKDQYPCGEEHCNFTTKRWSDFKRHSSSRHCTSPSKPFSCPIPWCKYSGDNGFARKDKLSSHYKTLHAGTTVPGTAARAIKPKIIGGA